MLARQLQGGPGELGFHNARVESVGSDVGGQPPRQLVSEQNVSKLRLGIGAPGRVATCIMKILKADSGALVGERGDCDDPGRPAEG